MYHFLICENSISSLAAAEASSAESFSGIPPSVLLKSSPIDAKPSCNGSATASSIHSQSGMMFKLSMDGTGPDESMSSAVDSPARTSASPPGPPPLALRESAADSGNQWQELLARYDLLTHSWKTHRCLWEEDLHWSSVILPKWGMMRDGVLFQRETPLGPTCEIERGFSLPTPTKCDHSKVSKNKDFWQRRFEQGRTGMDNLPEMATTIYPDGDGRIHPHLHEWLMGWPTGMTALKPLEMDKFQSWLQWHGMH